jgi:phosphate transport system permease protein
MSKVASSLVARRYGAERRFRLYGVIALGLTTAFLAFLVFDIVSKAIPAFSENRAALTFRIDPAKVDAADPRRGDFDGLAKDAFRDAFPGVTSRGDRKKLTRLLSSGAADDLRGMVVADPSLIGKDVTAPLLLSDAADQYLKGLMTKVQKSAGDADLQIAKAGEGYLLTGATLEKGDIVLTQDSAFEVGDGGAAEALIVPPTLNTAAKGSWQKLRFLTPEADRPIANREAVWLESLRGQGRIAKAFAWRLLSAGDSREPELAGIRGALIGSLLTVGFALLICLPLGIAAAVYLEEFAPKNRWSDLIEVNINNLAAVPSIIFGLLGLAVFLGTFGLPRSAPIVGGLVLALLVLPTIIISARAALKSIPPSIKEAALGVGASHQQAVFHHVLPLAMPGILTGTILAVARALGETAPLLMIGMVAFIVDIPKGFNDAATVLPVQIFLWSDLPEAAFKARTAAAIVILLAVLFAMNAVAIYLRRRFERRW